MVWSPADLLWSLTNRAQMTAFESVCANLFILLALSPLVTPIHNLIRGSQFNPEGKHVYLTGGSVGLGRAVAIELAKQGAHVTIIARKEGPLKETVELMKEAAATRKVKSEQKFHWVSADLTDREQAIRALDEASTLHGGRVPDIVMTCAGTSIPRFFTEAPIEDFEWQMKVNYFGTLYTVHEAYKRMVETGVKGKIVLTSSTLGLVGLVGYSSYCPTKFALRGTMFSPGYETENLTKPLLTREIEGSTGLTPEDAAKGMLKGLRKGYFAVTTDFDTNFLRVASKGVTPYANIGWDYILGLIAPIGATSFLWEADGKVSKYGKKNLKKEL
ncbi:3-dehydrosphinganine reductase [Linnemannia gamsii]|uniref:3-dehydrosphinganine reductase n=1 Tax=Linnemannia gamsii TaxID=64522 RepID=A0ABQ7KAA8_9FUNG|nr:3-dehydrosphinganine reductase [Linnemannia gamsii]